MSIGDFNGEMFSKPLELIEASPKIPQLLQPTKGVYPLMSDLDRGIMKFKGADNPLVIGISAALVLGSIAALIVWALRTAYVVS
jgi:hypothetical protein